MQIYENKKKQKKHLNKVLLMTPKEEYKWWSIIQSHVFITKLKTQKNMKTNKFYISLIAEAQERSNNNKTKKNQSIEIM